MERFFHQTYKNHIINATKSPSKQVKNVPNKGTFDSQLGNTLFPVWERFVPKVGIFSNKRSVEFVIRQQTVYEFEMRGTTVLIDLFF